MNQPPCNSPPGSPDLMGPPQAIHAAMEGMVTIDEQMCIIMMNPAAQRMFGRTAAECIGLPLGELMPERYRAAHKAHVKRFCESHETERSMGRSGQLFGLRANGEEFPLEVVICKGQLTTENGPLLCCTALLCDRSKEQALSREITSLNHQMRAIFESAPVAIWITDNGRIAFANRACSRLFGVQTAEHLIGVDIHHLLNLPHPVADFEWDNLVDAGSEEIKRLSGKVARPDGTERDIEVAVTRLPDHEKKLVQMVIVDTTTQTRERHNLLASRRTLRELSANIVDAREEERKRIARELHDELGQRLTALKMELSAYGQALGTGTGKNKAIGHDRLQLMIDMVDETVAATRRIALGLRPPMLDDLGLEAAFDWLISEFRRHNTVQVALRTETFQEPVTPAVAVTLYRILQEALTNIARHADAQEVQIELSTHEQWVQLTVQDDGQGFPKDRAAPAKGSFGLIGMRERVRVLGGQLKLQNGSRGGASIVVRLPMIQSDVAPRRHAIDAGAPASETASSPLAPWEES